MLNYSISKTLYNNISVKRDGKGKIIQRFSKADVIKMLNENLGLMGVISELEIV